MIFVNLLLELDSGCPHSFCHSLLLLFCDKNEFFCDTLQEKDFLYTYDLNIETQVICNVICVTV